MSKAPLFVITPTGGRQKSFDMLAGFLNAQTFDGPITWLVVDDCEPATSIPKMREGIEVKAIRAPWRWHVGMNTQAQMMTLALDNVTDSNARVAIMEDDDYYSPHHLLNVSMALESHELVGERIAVYYNVATRKWRELPGTYHASLCTTAMRGRAVVMLYTICANGSRRIDMDLWQSYSSNAKHLMSTRNVVGIKGLPGRGGIGVGHRESFGDPDPLVSKLTELVGYDQAMRYIRALA